MGYSPHCELNNRNYPLGLIIVRFDSEKLRTSTYSRPMKRFILLLGLAAASWSPLELRGADDSPDASLLAKEKEMFPSLAL
jgi:hypothetical protein